MKVTDKLKALTAAGPEGQKSLWDRVVVTTPVVMTVVATILASLSNGEMTAAQYHRAMAAQFQSKAADQWGFFQAKRLREASNQNTLELLEGLVGPGAFDARSFPSLTQEAQQRLATMTQNVSADAPKDVLARADGESRALAEQWKQALADPAVADAVRYLAGADLPSVAEKKVEVPAISDVLKAIEAGKSEAATVPLILAVKRDDLDQAETAASANADAFDAATKPIIASIDRIGFLVTAQTTMLRRLQRDVTADVSPDVAANVQLLREAGSLRQSADDLMSGFSAARLRFDARRYHQESAYNLSVAQLYEVEVRRSGGESDHNRDRSKNFFYGMLVAQMAVTIATFSLAVQQRSLLWGLASGAGLIAVGLGVYVYAFT
jgi:hypothetical protein